MSEHERQPLNNTSQTFTERTRSDQDETIEAARRLQESLRGDRRRTEIVAEDDPPEWAEDDKDEDESRGV